MQVKHDPRTNKTTVSYTATERSKILTAMALLAVNPSNELRQAIEVIRRVVPLAGDGKEF